MSRGRLSAEARCYVARLLENGWTRDAVAQHLKMTLVDVERLTDGRGIAALGALFLGNVEQETFSLGERISRQDILNVHNKLQRERIRPTIDSTRPGSTTLSVAHQLHGLRDSGWLAQDGVLEPEEDDEDRDEAYWIGLSSPWQQLVRSILPFSRIGS